MWMSYYIPESLTGKKLDMTKESIPSPERKDYLVPPVRLAIVHLNKPLDLAYVAQIALATGHVEVNYVGTTLSLKHPKVQSKVRSWNIDANKLADVETNQFDTVKELKAANSDARLVATTVYGGDNPFRFDWQPDDIIVIGGANGLSKADLAETDCQVSIPTAPETSFLTVASVVPSLTYHILTERGLWEKL
jgi:tRNA(Leu) C34 or U34 (ribose-2'-O)-methylase TrmL